MTGGEDVCVCEGGGVRFDRGDLTRGKGGLGLGGLSATSLVIIYVDAFSFFLKFAVCPRSS